MRSLVVVLALSLTLGGCSRIFGGNSRDATQNVSLSADSTLRIAATQLQHHGYTVTPVGERSLMTTPRAIPAWLAEKDGQMKGRQWFVQVNVAPHYLQRGSRLEVVGFMIPATANTGASATATPAVQNAIAVTSEHQLYQEVRAIASWIGDAARRK